MPIAKDARKFNQFEKSYWQYFLELEEQFLSTKRYVTFDQANFKTFSSEFLKLLEAICSEIDVVGKEIAHQIDSDFKITDGNVDIQKWWYKIQDWYREDTLEPIKLMDEIEFSPWAEYQIEEFVDKRGATRHRLVSNSKTPHWWTSYNKVKHSRTLDDPETQEKYFHRANLGNVCEAFSALYLLEKRYMMSVGRAVEYERCQKSKLFENEKPSFYVDEDGCWCQVIEEDD